MGTSTILDILGSIIIGGFLLLILWRLDDAAVKNNFNGTQGLILQENLATTTTILENDFRRIGYCKNYNLIPTTNVVVTATDSSISFLTDVNDAGVVNTLKYYLGTASEVTMTPNPRDRFLYRVVDNETPVGVSLGITQFKIVFFDVLGDTLFPPISPTSVSSIEINVAVENVAGYGGTSAEEEAGKYSSAFWRQIKLAAKNLQNR